MEMSSYQPGVPNWVDIGVPDAQAAADFYGALFGWAAEEGPAEFGGYRMAMLGDAAVAGIGPQMAPGPPYWTSYVAVTSVDETVAKAEAAGGSVLAPAMDIGTVGRMAIIADTGGVALGCWQAGDFAGCQRVNEAGTLGWNELLTKDLDAAEAFYGSVFGWTADRKVDPSQGEEPVYVEWQVDGRSVAGMLPRPDMIPAQVPDHWGVYFIVNDLDAATATVAEHGGSQTMPPMEIDVGRFAGFVDPAGASFNLMQLKDG